MKRSFPGTFALTLILLLVLTRIGAGQEQDERFQSLVGLDKYVEQLMEDWHVPGVAVGVISMKDPEAMYMKGFGFRDVERGLPVTPQTVFGIGSCAKAFTAAAMAALVTDGTLKWNSPIHEVVSDFRLFDDYSTLHATPRDLLTHRTGLAGYEMLRALPTWGKEGLWNQVRELEPSAGFRERFQYANLSYTMAGRVVEEVSGEAFEAFVRRRLLEPVGMESTTLSYRRARDSGKLAVPYLNFGVNFEFGSGPSPSTEFEALEAFREELVAPSGGVYSSLEDMMKWVRFHLNEGRVGEQQILAEGTLPAMHTAQIPIWSDPRGEEQTYLSYGMGWFVEDYRGHSTVQHEGQVFGYQAHVSMLPSEGIGVVVLTNAYYHHVHPIVTKNIFDRLLGLEIVDRTAFVEEFRPVAQALFQQATGFWDTRPEDPGTPSAPLEAYTGTFSHPLYGDISVATAGESLEVTFREEMAMELRHFSNDTFATETELLDFYHMFFRFQMGTDGTVEGVRLPLDEWEDGVLFARVAEG